MARRQQTKKLTGLAKSYADQKRKKRKRAQHLRFPVNRDSAACLKCTSVLKHDITILMRVKVEPLNKKKALEPTNRQKNNTEGL
jgi:hypothetical protein